MMFMWYKYRSTCLEFRTDDFIAWHCHIGLLKSLLPMITLKYEIAQSLTPMKHFLHIIAAVPAHRHIIQLLFLVLGGLLDDFEELILPGLEMIRCAMRFASWCWNLGFLWGYGLERTENYLDTIQNTQHRQQTNSNLYVSRSLLKPQRSYSFARARWSPCFHCRCTHSGTLRDPSFRGAQSRRSLALRAASSWVDAWVNGLFCLGVSSKVVICQPFAGTQVSYIVDPYMLSQDMS